MWLQKLYGTGVYILRNKAKFYWVMSWRKKKWQHKGCTSSFILYWLQLPTTAVHKWNKNKQFSNLVCFSNGLKKARPGFSLAFQTKIALSSDQAGYFCSCSRIFLSQSGSISSWKFVPFLPVYYYMSVAPVKERHFRFRQKMKCWLYTWLK